MTKHEEYRKELIEILEMAKKEGLKCFICKNTDYNYGYLVTENDNVLCISTNAIWGFDLSLEYIPSRNNGSGCCCNKEPVFDISIDTIREMEKEGLAFARRLGAKLYINSEQFFTDKWHKESVMKV